jgi:hypothetical protein
MARKRKNKELKKTLNIFIACEDSSGGLKYIKDLIRNYGFYPNDNCINKNITDLKNLVNSVYRDKGEIKIVFVDVDDKLNSLSNKQNVNTAIQKARSNKICIIVSNECLELWFLLHLKSQTAYINRDEIFKKLKEELLKNKKNVLTKDEIKNLENNKIKSIDWFKIFDEKEKQEAIKRCKNLIKNKTTPFNPWRENPITLMCCFIDFLENLKKINNPKSKQKIENLIKKCYPMIGMEIKNV